MAELVKSFPEHCFAVAGWDRSRVRARTTSLFFLSGCVRVVRLPPPPAQENLLKLADAKAEFVTEQFGRIEESVLQLQAFAEQALLATPETMVVDSHVASVSALDTGLLAANETTFDFGVW